MKQLLFILFIGISMAVTAQNEAPPTIQSYPPMVSAGELLGIIPALRDLPPQTIPTANPNQKQWQKKNYFFANELKNPNPQPQNGDPLVALQSTQARELGQDILPGFNIEGIYDANVTPPDPTGDVGKDHYVQMVNTSGGAWFQAWSKETGQSVLGPILTSTIWSQVNTGSIGDPIIQYDHDAQRWLMMEMQGSSELLLAISDDSDPGNGWKAYRFQTLGFPDYPKLYVWHNAYMVTTNEIVNGNVCSGFALERDAILAGAPTFKVFRFEMPNFGGIIYQPATGADWEGGPPPPPNSPSYIFRVYDDIWAGNTDQLQIWEVNLNWADGQLSNITGPKVLNPAPFETTVCFGSSLFDCIEQPDPNAPKVTALENIIMYRAPYRNFGTHESVVFNHIADVSGQIGEGGDAAVRWYELRKSGASDWSIYQQGTYAPDLETNRFTGTLSMDEAGNIGLGYSVCSQQTNLGLRITGRRASDPLNQMTLNEYTLIPGTASHFDQRWGDYSNMSVDPVDGRTFWFTGEYQPLGQSWATRIGSFRIQRDTFDILPSALVAPLNSALLGTTETVSVEIRNNGLVTAKNFPISLWFDGVFVATEIFQDSIIADATKTFTFPQTVSMDVIGKTYPFTVVTAWEDDKFIRNDTLRAKVKKLTSNDGALIGKFNLPGLVCGKTQTFGVLLSNASGLPMTSSVVHYKNHPSQSYSIYNWTGNLAPGKTDTVFLTLTDVREGLNRLSCYITEPNGLPDQNINNDTIIQKFFGNLDGAYLTAKGNNDFGTLNWEVYNGAQLLYAGLVTNSDYTESFCTEDNTCYTIKLKPSGFGWGGKFSVFDIFGNVLVSTNNLFEPESISFCTPERKQNDIGAIELLSPVSGSDLNNNEPVTVMVRNFGKLIQHDFQVTYSIDGSTPVTMMVPDTLYPTQSKVFTFQQTADVGVIGQPYVFVASATVQNDELTNNDAITRTVLSRYQLDAKIDGITLASGCDNPESTLINFKLTNNGVTTLSSVVIGTKVNGGIEKLDTFLIFTATDEVYLLYIVLSGAVFGVNTVDLRLVEVNNEPIDGNLQNNTATANITIDANSVGLSLFISTDAKPNETSWQILDNQNNVILEDGSYQIPFNQYAYSTCVQKDSCYRMVLTDTGGDGLDGYVSISLFTGDLLYGQVPGNFGTTNVINFCAVSACTNFVTSAQYVNPSSPAASDGSIKVIATGGIEPYTYVLYPIGIAQPDPLFSNLPNGFYTVVCIDGNGCLSQLTIELGTVKAEEPTLRLAEIKALPNPTTGLVWLEMDAQGNSENSIVYQVLDQQGHLLTGGRMSRWDNTFKGTLSLEKYPSGLYFVRVKNGQTVKIVRQ